MSIAAFAPLALEDPFKAVSTSGVHVQTEDLEREVGMSGLHTSRMIEME